MGLLDDLRVEISVIEKRIRAIQQECSHPLDVRDKDPYSRAEEGKTYYGTHNRCLLCDKTWDTEQR